MPLQTPLHPVTGKPLPPAYDIVKDILKEYHALSAQPEQKKADRITYHPMQEKIRAEARRFNVLDCGRRWGKTKLLCDILIEAAEQGFPTGYFAPSYKYLLDGWRDIKEMTKHIVGREISETEKRMVFPGGGVIECWSLSDEGAGEGRKTYKAGRGRKYKVVVVDEAAYVAELEGAFEYAIDPTLLDLVGDAWFASTPNGKGGFYRFFKKGQHGEFESDLSDPNWMSWKMPTSTNPYMPATELVRLKATKADHVYRQEYEAEFLEDSGQVFRNLSACTFPKYDILDEVGRLKAKGIWQEYMMPNHVYVMAWDLAKKEDFSVIGVIDCTLKQLVHFDRFNQVEYLLQIPRLVAIAEKFQPVEIVVEENGNIALMELLRITKYAKMGPEPRLSERQRQGLDEDEIMLAEAVLRRFRQYDNYARQRHLAPLPVTDFKVTNASKQEAIQALVLAFERQDIGIPDDGVLLGELEDFGMKRTAAGNMTYAAPSGSHDDTVMMLAEGWYKARRYMSEENLSIREKALRALDPTLLPDNIKNNPNMMAGVSQEYWIQAHERSEQAVSGSYMGQISGFGR